MKTKSTDKVLAAGYIRVSTLSQKEKDTPEIQRDQIKKYCALHDLHLFKIYQDTISGTKDDRPALNALFEDAEARKFKRVIFTKLDRFGRSLKFILECYDRLEGMDIGVVSISEAIDTSTPVGKLLRNILATLAEFEASRIAERMYEGRYLKTAQKQSIPGREPYGYRWESGKAILDEDEAAVLRKMFDYYLVNRLAIRHLVERINREGFKTRHGKYWQGSSVTRILKNPVYTGQAVYFRDHDKPILLSCPQVITPAQHARVLELMGDNNTRRELYPRNLRKDDPFLLRGLLTCGNCGSKMLSLYDGMARVRRYVCHWSKRKKWTDLAFRNKKCDLPAVDATKLESLVLNRIKFFMISPKKVLEQLKAEAVDTKQMEKEINKLQMRITLAQEGVSRLYGLYEDAAINKSELIARLQERQAEVSRLEEQKAEKQKHFDFAAGRAQEAAQIEKDTESLLMEGSKRVHDVLQDMTNMETKEFLRTVIDGRLTVVDSSLKTLGAVAGVFNYGAAYTWLFKFRNPKLREYGLPPTQ